jgi:hypothetical protein
MIKVRTSIMDNYFDATTEVVVDDILFRRVTQPLDFPSPHADAFSRGLCSSDAMIKMIMTDREILSKEIANAITRQLLDFMKSKDTVMGYKVIHAGQQSQSHGKNISKSGSEST